MSDVDAPTRGLLDTNTVILLQRLRDPQQLPPEATITAVSLAELCVGPLVAANDAERAARQAHLDQAESDFEPVPFDAAAARAFGQVAADLRRAGRKTSARAYDALIAATVIASGLPLYTVNPDDYLGISGLRVVAVAHPDADASHCH